MKCLSKGIGVVWLSMQQMQTLQRKNTDDIKKLSTNQITI